MSHQQNDKILDWRAEQEATIALCRRTLERFEHAYSDLTPDELNEVRKALKGMRANDDLEPITRLGRDENGNLKYV
jgi:hypothetical protein